MKYDKSKVLVSISCTAYNHEPYIAQCLEGFVMQKTNFKFEAIVHDDASTDKTAEIIREYAEKYPDIIKPIYEAENQYSKYDGSIRRIMNAQMRGKYIAMCEGDDYWIDPMKLQKQVDFLDNNPNYSLCCHDAFRYYEGKVNQASYFNDYIVDCELCITDILNQWVIPTASMLYRQSIMEGNEVFCTKYKPITGDLIIQLICAAKGNIWYINQPMSVYRVNLKGDSMTARSKGREEYLFHKQMQMYRDFSTYTDGKFEEVIQNAINFKTIQFKISQQKRKQGFVIYYLTHPIALIKRIKSYVHGHKR
ncbi:MAG: glycosyltransferase [Eubacteriales bacterium]|nr:glycosyltransferase [Eubacteriales bacterium]MDD4476003.1 glycosyltransferase [Eubacteriales bacterium]